MNDLLNFYIISNDFYICLLKVMYIGSKRTESPGYYCFYKSGECKLKIVHVVAQITCNTIKHTIISKNFYHESQLTCEYPSIHPKAF